MHAVFKKNNLDDTIYLEEQKCTLGASQVAQWLRIHVPIQGTRVQSLVREDPTCYKATKPMCHNY